jgi:hypothetical protein
MDGSGWLLVLCIGKGEISFTIGFIEKCVPGEIDKNKIPWACYINAYLANE